MYDILGNEVRSTEIQGDKLVIARNDLKEGIYIYQVLSGRKPVATGKLVIR
jgi:hypothetical protein